MASVCVNNAKYYGWKAALNIAIIMFTSIVLIALILNGLFLLAGIIPESGWEIAQITRFKTVPIPFVTSQIVVVPNKRGIYFLPLIVE